MTILMYDHVNYIAVFSAEFDDLAEIESQTNRLLQLDDNFSEVFGGLHDSVVFEAVYHSF